MQWCHLADQVCTLTLGCMQAIHRSFECKALELCKVSVTADKFLCFARAADKMHRSILFSFWMAMTACCISWSTSIQGLPLTEGCLCRFVTSCLHGCLCLHRRPLTADGKHFAILLVHKKAVHGHILINLASTGRKRVKPWQTVSQTKSTAS